MKKSILKEFGFFALFLVAWGCMYFPALLYINEGFLGGIRSDVAAYIYYVMHNMQRVITFPSAGYDGNYFYPFGNSLAFSDNFILPALIAKPIYLLSGNISLAWNSVMVLAPVVSGYLTFCLTRYITGTILTALVAGFAFMCLPFIYGHLGHPQLQFSFGIPAVILATLHFAQTRNPFSASLIGFIVFIQFFSTVYYSLIAYLLAALILLGYALLRFKTIKIRDIAVLGAVNIPWMLAVYFTTKPYMAVRDAFAPWPLELVRRLSASFSSYITTSPRHLLWGHWAGPFAKNGSYLSTGFTVLLLASICILGLLLFRRLGNNSDNNFKIIKNICAIVIFSCVGFLVVLGIFSPTTINLGLKANLISAPLWIILFTSLVLLVLRGLSAKDKKLEPIDFAYLLLFLVVFFFFASLGIISRSGQHELYYYMHHYLPGFNGLRAAYRFGIITGLMLILLASLTLSRKKPVIILIAFALIIAEYKTYPYRSTLDKTRPGIYNKLEKIPGNEAVISLPFDSPLKSAHYSRKHTAYMLWTAPSLRPMMSGWSSKVPKYYQFKGNDIDTFPSQTSLTALGQVVGLKYLIFNHRYAHDFDKQAVLEGIEQAGAQVKLIHMNKRGSFLAELAPHVFLNTLEYPEIYFVPDTKNERTISFEVKTTSPMQLVMHSDFDFEQTVQLVGNGQWEKIELTLPRSKGSVIPQKLVFSELPEQSVVLRKVKIVN